MFPSFRKNGIFIEIYKEIFLFYESNERWVFTIRVSQRRSLFLSLSLSSKRREKRIAKNWNNGMESSIDDRENANEHAYSAEEIFFFFYEEEMYGSFEQWTQITRKDIPVLVERKSRFKIVARRWNIGIEIHTSGGKSSSIIVEDASIGRKTKRKKEKKSERNADSVTSDERMEEE